MNAVQADLELRGELWLGVPQPAGGPDHAAQLIEAAGLKGLREGGAQVSTKHANFIINTSGASARDIAGLIEWVQVEVERTSGVRLKAEVRRVGQMGNTVCGMQN